MTVELGLHQSLTYELQCYVSNILMFIFLNLITFDFKYNWKPKKKKVLSTWKP